MELQKINQGRELLRNVKYKVLAGYQAHSIYSTLRIAGVNPVEHPKLMEYLKSIEEIEGNSEQQKSALSVKRMEVVQEYFEELYIVYKDKDGSRTPLKYIGYNQVEEVKIDEIVSDMLRLAKSVGMPLSRNKAEAMAETCLYSASQYLTKLPPSFSLEEHELTFNRVKLTLKNGPTPTYDSIFSRMNENADAAKAFFWSVFTTDSCDQYLWIYGEGQDGKGSLIRMMTKVLGVRATTALDAKDDHWAAKLVGKRLGTFNDLTNTHVILTSTFKQLTGGDQLIITEKYKASYSALLDAKVIVTTNNPIPMTSRKSDIRRIIYCALNSSEIEIPDFESKLDDEASAFLFDCREKYTQLYNKSSKKIKCTNSHLKEEAENYESKYSSLVENRLILKEDVYETAADFFEYFNDKFNRNSLEYQNFTKYLERNHNLKPSKMQINGATLRVFKGLKIRF